MKIKQDKKLNKLIILFGVVVLIIGLIMSFTVTDNDLMAKTFNILIPLGGSSICGGIGGLYGIKQLEKNPTKYKQVEIEMNDERNKFIRLNASARAGDITNWLVIILSYVFIVLDYPFWITLSLVAIFVLKYILQIILFNRFAKIL